MRWIAWLLTGTTCLAGYGGPLPEIELGTRPRELVVQGPPRLPEGGMCQTFLVGTVTEVAAEEDRQPQRTKLSESCTLQVEAAYGYLPQVAGIQTAVLKASYEQSPYALVEEDWGRLWHFKKGQRLIVMLHVCNSDGHRELCFEPEELIPLGERTAALPDILRRTALLPEEFTDADLKVLKEASPLLHQWVLAETAGEREMRTEKSRRRRDAMMVVAVICSLVVLGAWGLRKGRK